MLHRTICRTSLAIAVTLAATPIALAGRLPIPKLNWVECDDWVNVKTEVKPRAVGNGKADDTAALKAAFGKMHGQGGGSKVVYLPAGTYRITDTIVMPSSVGCMVLGHGRNTRIVWDGEAGKRMFWSNGSTIAKYVGIVWDGNGKAGVGVHHQAHDRFECKVRHEHSMFMNFTEAGVKLGPQKPFATSESCFINCAFYKCAKGVAMVDFNYYNEVVEGCEFRDCDFGIYCNRYGEVYVRDTHFRNSAKADMQLGDSHKHSVRRCTSYGSSLFIKGGAVTIQDCQVANWKNKDGAVRLWSAHSPIPIFDCVFTEPPSRMPPVYRTNGSIKLIVSNNVSKDTNGILANTENVVEIPAGKLGASLSSPTQRFLKDSVRLPTKVFDAVKDFGGGKGDNTKAVQKTIDAARNWGRGAVAWFPPGRYRISKTIEITGRDYFIAGTGYHSEFQWKGPEGGVVFEVKEPDHITIQDINIIGHSVPKNMTGIHHVGTGLRSSIVYDRVMVPRGFVPESERVARGIRFLDLGRRDRVHIRRLYGGGSFTNCGAADILANFWDGAPILVENPKRRKASGFLGVLNSNTANHGGVMIHDSQSLVIGDMYAEQGKSMLITLTGNKRDRPGRATIGAARLHLWKEAPGFVTIDNYHGLFTYAHGHITRDKSPSAYTVNHRGKNRFEMIFMSHSAGHFAFNSSDGVKPILIQNNGMADSIPDDALKHASWALDHFRELGAMDLKFNYGMR